MLQLLCSRASWCFHNIFVFLDILSRRPCACRASQALLSSCICKLPAQMLPSQLNHEWFSSSKMRVSRFTTSTSTLHHCKLIQNGFMIECSKLGSTCCWQMAWLHKRNTHPNKSLWTPSNYFSCSLPRQRSRNKRCKVLKQLQALHVVPVPSEDSKKGLFSWELRYPLKSQF